MRKQVKKNVKKQFKLLLKLIFSLTRITQMSHIFIGTQQHKTIFMSTFKPLGLPLNSQVATLQTVYKSMQTESVTIEHFMPLNHSLLHDKPFNE